MPQVVTGTGDSEADGRRQANNWVDSIVFDWIDSIVLPNIYYRDDIGERLTDENGERLQASGLLCWGAP